MRDVAVISFAQMKNVRRETILNEVEMLMPVIEDVRSKAGLTQQDIGFTCSGSTDYLSGQAFSFVSTLDGIGPWPPIQESHVEMDGAFALYEAWVKLQLGEATYTARVVTVAQGSDLAILQVYNPDPKQPILRLGSASTARVGQEVIAVGSALGVLSNTVTRGIVSAIRDVGTVRLIQTDAAINPGGSRRSRHRVRRCDRSRHASPERSGRERVGADPAHCIEQGHGGRQ